MKANELRIGNFIIANGLYEGKILEVEQIGSKGTLNEKLRVINFKIQHAGEFIKHCDPIPLTEEWLIKFGFKNLSIGLFELTHNNVIGYRLSIEGQYGYEEIKYVHQLQNLYFALIYKELELK